VALFAARPLASMLPRRGRTSVARIAIPALLLSVLCAASVTARYGNARFDMFTDDEVEAVDRMQQLAPPGSVLVAGASSTPWAAQDYDTDTRQSVQSICEADYSPTACVVVLQHLAEHAGSVGGITLLLTRGNQASLEMQGQMTDDEFARFEAGIAGLTGTQLLYSNADARVYHLASATAATSRRSQ
jgi:hypothetical protein